MSDGAELLKYVTKRVVTYMEQPKSAELRRERKSRKEPFLTKWFGQLLPIGIHLWWSGRKNKARS